jgi:polar amino acid transport system permease protein
LEAFYEWFRGSEATGINLTIVYDEFDRKRMIACFWTTVWLCLVCILLRIVIGGVGAAAGLATEMDAARRPGLHRAVPRHAAPGAIFFYFGLGALLPRVEKRLRHSRAGADQACSGRLSRCRCSPAPSTSRSSGRASRRCPRRRWRRPRLDYSRLGAYVHVVLPLAVRICLPALNNNIVNLVKTTTLAYAIAVPEMLYVSKQIWSDATNVPEMMTFLLLAYFFLVGCVVWAMARVERALKVPGIGL